MCVAFLIVFPPCLAYWIGEVLEIIAEDVIAQTRGNGVTCDNIRKMIKCYTNLFMAVGEINKLLKFPTLMIHTIITTQQMTETFTLLTVRDSGMGSGVSLFIDLMVILYSIQNIVMKNDLLTILFFFVQLSFLRVAYSFYALTYLTRGMEKIEEAIRICVYRLQGNMSIQTRASTKEMKEIQRRIRCIKAIKLSIGPYALKKDIALQGSFFYINEKNVKF